MGERWTAIVGGGRLTIDCYGCSWPVADGRWLMAGLCSSVDERRPLVFDRCAVTGARLSLRVARCSLRGACRPLRAAG